MWPVFINLAGASGKRSALPNVKFMIHQPMGGAQGQTADIEIQAKRNSLFTWQDERILHKHSGQSIEKILEDTERNYFMSAEEAMEYDIIDEVISVRK